ncbi:anti-sigma factor [Sphingomonas sp.]|uniref:anti-sigma factor family protein n=1 Tax=Sphingomonas sp. TaxID=28214 RepID=UPI001ED2738C|nr:anti-sigma factor [Sphingomonas sp.]MBX3595741.1 anti-sigma factor [Sphingomonas sp.]
MTIDPETLMAYADGELDPIAAKRVERAIADDPALRARVADHRALAGMLRDAFDPVADAPVPPHVEAMVRDAAKVSRLAPRPVSRERPLWMAAVAASLVAGLLAAPLVAPGAGGGDIAFGDGRAVARGAVAHALDTQLASTQAADAPIRIGVSFRDAGGQLCRTFEQDGGGGIACADGKDWALRRYYGDVARQDTAYRQAGSSAAMMADAQAMMAGDPLDAGAEAAALAARR